MLQFSDNSRKDNTMHENVLTGALSCTKLRVTPSVSAHCSLLTVHTLLIRPRLHGLSVGWTEVSPPAAEELLSVNSGKIIICQKLIALRGSVRSLLKL